MKHDFSPVAPLGRSNISHLRPAGFDTFWFGVCYYPEHWDAETRALDAERMAAAGVNVVRMGEFAWDLMERVEGVYDFSLFDETIAHLARHGIKTIFCTPTAAPPRWLTVQHPEILRQDRLNTELKHGSRQHADYSHPTFREYSRRITEVLAEHYKDNTAVIGWQTDNEIYCHFSDDHSPATRAAFIAFLKEKYAGDIVALNRAWGTAFWAQTYGSFEEIDTPYENRPTYPNPSQQLDYARFLSETVARFQHEQIALLRAANAGWFITHNGVMSKTDYRGLFTQDLDVLGYDVYPFFDTNPTSRPCSHAFGLDRVRAFSGNFIVPEHQAAAGGQAPYFHNAPEPGEMRLFTYRSIARGADSVLYFRWRTCRFGAEIYWCGILDHDNVPRRRYAELSQIGGELKRVGPALLGTSVRVEVAFAEGDYAATEAHLTYPLGLPSEGTAAVWSHRWFFERGYAVGCVHPADNLDGVKLYIIPHWTVFDPAWVPALERFVERGGVLVIGARTASRTLDNQVTAETLPGCLAKLAGVTVEEYGRQNKGDLRPQKLQLGETEVESADWYEVLGLQGAEALATWTTRHLVGLPAISHRKVGRGHVLYVGTYFCNGALFDALWPVAGKLAGVSPQLVEHPAGIEVVVREKAGVELWFMLNRNETATRVPHPPLGQDLVTGTTVDGPCEIEASGVRVVVQRR
ncbi:MAG: beta-galactosidase [Verrucomicrobiota bacterium]|nr:beta-galactosidase [Verrucomicrobiota bacterium]